MKSLHLPSQTSFFPSPLFQSFSQYANNSCAYVFLYSTPPPPLVPCCADLFVNYIVCIKVKMPSSPE